MSSDYYESKESDKKPDIIFEKSKNFKILFFTRNNGNPKKKQKRSIMLDLVSIVCFFTIQHV